MTITSKATVAIGLFLLGLAIPPGRARAQVDEPLESPHATLTQVVGTQPITISWFSPGVKEREIWGELVPYNQNWRAGANDKTTITFSEDVVIAGTLVPAGSYGFYIFPEGDTAWQMVLNESAVGSPNEFVAAEDVVRVTVEPREAPFRERLRYSIDDFSDWPPYRGEIVLHWERKQVALGFVIKASQEKATP